MGRKVEMKGRRFGILTVAAEDGRSAAGQVMWACDCECGGSTTATGGALRSGNTKSCGCQKYAGFEPYHTARHGHAPALRVSDTYKTWAAMIQRCTNRKHPDWPDYGGRGIKVCRKWRRFEGFLEDMGERPYGRTLDRKDNAGGYDKKNCRWATADQQAQNHRNNKLTMKLAQAMRADRVQNKLTTRELGKKYGVSHVMARHVINNKAWKITTKDL